MLEDSQRGPESSFLDTKRAETVGSSNQHDGGTTVSVTTLSLGLSRGDLQRGRVTIPGQDTTAVTRKGEGNSEWQRGVVAITPSL